MTKITNNFVPIVDFQWRLSLLTLKANDSFQSQISDKCQKRWLKLRAYPKLILLFILIKPISLNPNLLTSHIQGMSGFLAPITDGGKKVFFNENGKHVSFFIPSYYSFVISNFYAKKHVNQLNARASKQI